MDDDRQPDGQAHPEPVTRGDWVRGVIVVLLASVALVAGGLWIVGHAMGGCGAALPC